MSDDVVVEPADEADAQIPAETVQEIVDEAQDKIAAAAAEAGVSETVVVSAVELPPDESVAEVTGSEPTAGRDVADVVSEGIAARRAAREGNGGGEADSPDAG